MPTHRRRFVLGPLVIATTILLAACGATTSTTSPPATKDQTTSSLHPVSLNGVAITALVSAPLESTVRNDLASLTQTYPHLRITIVPQTPIGMDPTSLTDQANLRLFSVNPGQTLLAQLGGVERIPIGTSTLYVAADLGKLAPVTLTSAILIGILEGSITNWDNTLIAMANPHITFPNLPITVSPLPASGQRAAIIAHELSVPPSNFGATTTPHCTTTPGCVSFTLSPPSSPLAIEGQSGQSSLPTSSVYPLVTDELAVVTIDPAHPRREAAAVRIVELLVANANLPSATRTSELVKLRSLITKLTIEHYTNDPVSGNSGGSNSGGNDSGGTARGAS